MEGTAGARFGLVDFFELQVLDLLMGDFDVFDNFLLVSRGDVDLAVDECTGFTGFFQEFDARQVHLLALEGSFEFGGVVAEDFVKYQLAPVILAVA